MPSYLYQFTKVFQYFCELKTKPNKSFKSTKWLRHFVLWYYLAGGSGGKKRESEISINFSIEFSAKNFLVLARYSKWGH
jgi:hypothetical protein